MTLKPPTENSQRRPARLVRPDPRRRSTTNWSRRSAARSPRRPRWTPRSSAATACCASSSAPTRTASCCSQPSRSQRGFTRSRTDHAFPADFGPSRPSTPGAPSRRNACRRRSTSRAAMACRTRDPHLFATGTNLVVALDDRLILKIFPPLLRASVRVGTRLRCRSFADGCQRADSGNRARRRARPVAVSRHHAACTASSASQAWPTLPEDQKERVLAADRRDHRGSAARPGGRVVRHRAALGPSSSPGKSRAAARGMSVSGLPQKFLDGLDDFLRDAADADSAGRAAGDPDRRIHSGEFSAEPRRAGAGGWPG